MSNLIPPNSFHIQVRQASFRRCSLYPLRSIVPLPYAGTYSRKKMDHPPGLFPFPACRLKVGALSSSRLIFSHYNTTANGLAIDIVIPTFFFSPRQGRPQALLPSLPLNLQVPKKFHPDQSFQKPL